MATFFFDNDISFRIAKAIASLVHDHEVISLRDRFDVNTADTEWIPQAGASGWIVISRDHNQRRRNAEHKALLANGVRVIYIRYHAKPDTLFSDAARIIKNWPRIQTWGLAAKPGTLARLSTTDNIEQICMMKSETKLRFRNDPVCASIDF